MILSAGSQAARSDEDGRKDLFIVQFPAAYCLAMVASLADSTEPTRLEAVLDLDGQGRVSVTSGTSPTAAEQR
jgi:hypothetical protein